MNTNTNLVHYPYPKIGQFRNVVKTVQLRAAYAGDDIDGEPVYDSTLSKPTIEFTGTVKLHGTNAAIVLDRIQDIIYFQSRENIITPLKDNAGCATYLASIEHNLELLFSDIPGDVVVVYGEWAGQSIQKGVGISQLPKAFYIFDIKVDGKWLDEETVGCYNFERHRIYNIYNFPTYKVTIDFNHPELSQNTLVELTDKIEKECPVAKALGIDNGVGEGIVWRGGGHMMKVKGEEHSASKVKTLASVDIEKVQGILDFVQQTVTESRCQQMLDKLKEGGREVDQKDTGDFLKLVREDILAEELDTLVGNGLEVKDLNGPLSKAARNWFMQNI